MTVDGGKHLIIAELVGAALIESASAVAHGKRPPGRTLLGLTIAGAVLLLVSDGAPELAAAMGGAVLVGALYTHGAAAFAVINKQTNGGAAATSKGA